MSKRILILASKRSNGEFVPEEIVGDLEDLYSGLEYGDVYEGEDQIWEYPSGKIYQITPDQEVDEKNYYSLPGSGLWKPLLKEISVEKDKVNIAINQFLKFTEQA